MTKASKQDSFSDHFSGHAELYRRARPTYPEALFAWLAETAPATEFALDVGTGNGQAARALAEHFTQVLGVDPSAQQVERAAEHPRVSYQVAPAEALPVADASVDLLVSAQAAHWFDLPAFYAECARVVRPGGLVALWSYGVHRVTPAVDAPVWELYATTLGPYWPPERRHVEGGYADLGFPFPLIPAPDFEMSAAWDVDAFVGYLLTWSATQRYIRATGENPVEALVPELKALWGDGTRDVVWPLTVVAGRVG